MTNHTIFDDLQTLTGGSRKAGIPKVKIMLSKIGKTNFYFSSGFIQSLGENYKSHLLLSYSRKNNAIIFEFTDNFELPGIVKISRPVKINTALVALQTFINQFNLDASMIRGDYIPVYQKIAENKSAWVIYLDKKLKGV
jgi:hypothetical protein